MGDTVAVRAGLFEGDPPHLVGGRCGACGRHHFPHAGRCPYCTATGVEEVALSTHGTVWAATTVTAPPPGYRGPVPYGFGVVELPEGLRVVTRLVGEPACGQAVQLALEPLHHDDEGRTVVTYAFAPAP